MKITTKREIFIERERTLTVRLAAAPALKFCHECQAEANFITVGQAAILRQTTDCRIFRLIEAGRLHHVESAEGRIFVCLTSLQAFSAGDVFD